MNVNRFKLVFMQCKYAIHTNYGVIVASVKCKFMGKTFFVQGKSKCPPSIFDELEGKKLARARAERSAYIVARNEVRMILKNIERMSTIVNNSLNFFDDCISHQDEYIDTF